MSAGLRALSLRLELAEPGRLEAAQRRARVLLNDLDQLDRLSQRVQGQQGSPNAQQDAKAGPPAPADQARALTQPPTTPRSSRRSFAVQIRASFEMLSRWDAAAQLVPALVARLRSLRAVHEACADAGARLARLEDRETALRDQLQQDQAVLAQAQASHAPSPGLIANA